MNDEMNVRLAVELDKHSLVLIDFKVILKFYCTFYATSLPTANIILLKRLYCTSMTISLSQ